METIELYTLEEASEKITEIKKYKRKKKLQKFVNSHLKVRKQKAIGAILAPIPCIIWKLTTGVYYEDVVRLFLIFFELIALTMIVAPYKMFN